MNGLILYLFIDPTIRLTVNYDQRLVNSYTTYDCVTGVFFEIHLGFSNVLLKNYNKLFYGVIQDSVKSLSET